MALDIPREEVREALATLAVDELGVEIDPDDLTEDVVMQDVIPDSVARSDLLGMLRKKYRISKERFSDQEAATRLAGKPVSEMIDVVLEHGVAA